MATMSISTTPTTASAMVTSAIAQTRFLGPYHARVNLVGLPAIATKGRVRCAAEGNHESGSIKTMGASLLAAVSSAAVSSPAMALVDERMSTEGTGLPFGLSNNLLGWILLGVFGLIWTLYFTYASDLDEDDDSGLSL